MSAGVAERPGNLLRGRATVHTKGDVRGTLYFDLGPPAYFRPPPGDMALEWIESYGTALSIEGGSFLGSRSSSPTLVVRLVIGNDSFTSAPGQCLIAVRTARPEEVRGRFTCRGLRGEGKTIDARGTFSARR